MMAKVIIIIIFMLISAQPSVLAQVFHYRMDTLTPDVVFQRGFRVLGNENDVLAHVLGNSCLEGNADSRFISVTTDRDVALTRGSYAPNGITFYLYRIRPTINFNNSYNSLIYAYLRTGDRIYENAAEDYRFESEWLAVPPEGSQTAILGNQVIDAVQYWSRGMTRTPLEGETFRNAEYSDQNTWPNPQPYIFTPSVRPDDASNSACNSCMSRSSSVRKKRQAIVVADMLKNDREKWKKCLRAILFFKIH